jgi:two-component system OmpR family sensor kinase
MKNASPTSLLRRMVLGSIGVMLLVWLLALGYVARQTTLNQARVTTVLNTSWARKVALVASAVAPRASEVTRIGAAMEQLRQSVDRDLNIEAPNRTRIWLGQALVYSSAHETHAPFPEQPAGTVRERAGSVSYVERDAASGITVESSMRVFDGWTFITAGPGFVFTPLLMSLPLLVLCAWLLVRLGLRPLNSISAAIEQRSSSDLAPLPASRYLELAPLVGAINALMARLTERIVREQEFLTDAAHELKTPLAIIQINAHRLIGQDAGGVPEPRMLQAAAGLREGIARASHTVHQLLAFERALREPDAPPAAPIELATLVRERLALAATLALQREVEVEFELDAPCALAVHRESATALLDNVIGNAVKYSPDGARVLVRLAARAGAVHLSVSDQGAGIAPALRRKVFERFYRIPGQDTPGSGLGLAIAERAAERNGATITLEDGPDRRGLVVVIRFDPSPAGGPH